MLFTGILLGIIIGFIFKGKISNLADVRLNKFFLILISLLAQLALLATPLSRVAWFVQNGSVLYIISLDILLFGLILNWNFGLGFRLIILGTTLNFIVIASNNGTIPVDLDKLSVAYNQNVVELKQEFDSHTELSYRQPLDSKSSLSFLGDVIYIPVPVLLDSNVYSIGDAFIAIGLGWFVVGTMSGNYRFPTKPDRSQKPLTTLETASLETSTG